MMSFRVARKGKKRVQGPSLSSTLAKGCKGWTGRSFKKVSEDSEEERGEKGEAIKNEKRAFSFSLPEYVREIWEFGAPLSGEYTQYPKSVFQLFRHLRFERWPKSESRKGRSV